MTDQKKTGIQSDGVAGAFDIPSPPELADEILHKKHKRHRLGRLARISMHVFFYLCFLAVIAYFSYLAYERWSNYRAEHEDLRKKAEAVSYEKKRLTDIERTLKVSYEFLSKYEAHYYGIIFDDFSRAYGVPWEMYAALIRIESNFDPTAKSDKDARGLTQVIERTGKSTAASLGLRYKEGVTLWNDLLNMVIGFTYFSEGYRARLNEGATRDEALQHAIKRYLGGVNYNVDTKTPSATGHGKEKRVYVSEYTVTVWQEYKKLQYVFKGVCADTTGYDTDPVVRPLDKAEGG